MVEASKNVTLDTRVFGLAGTYSEWRFRCSDTF